jgi:predicted permease
MASVAFPGTGANWFQDRKAYALYLFARLKPNVSLEQAVAAINGPYHSLINNVDAPLQRMSEQTLAKFKAKELKLEPGRRGQSELHKDAGAPLQILFGVTVFVLLIACANIANLLLARAATRSGEMAVRLSIGGSRRQLIAQLLTESCLLAALGGALGLLVAQWTLNLISSLIPPEITTLVYRIDGTVIFFTAAVTLAAGILFGVFPALHSTRPNLVSALKGQAGQPGGSRTAARFRTVLATSQIALSMALLILAGLFTKSLFNINQINLGFRVENVITFGVSPTLNGYPPERTFGLYQRIEDELRALPGATGVTSSTVPLLGGDSWGNTLNVQGFQSGPDIDSNSRYSFIGPDYFRLFGIPLLAGREFTVADAHNAQEVAVVNEKFAQKFNLGRDAIGKRIAMGRGDKLNIEIVGVAQNSKYSEVKGEIPPVFYLPYRQRPVISANNFYLKTGLDPKQMLGAITPLVARVDPNLPVEHLRTMPEQVQANVTVDRVIGILSAAFAAVATLLAAIGLYGVLAYTVAQRTREIGVRMALGAAPGRVRSMVLRQVGWMTVIGGVLGLGAAIAIGRFAESLLFNLNGRDPVVLASAACLLVLVSLGAGFIPAHRASRVDPMRALRYE